MSLSKMVMGVLALLMVTDVWSVEVNPAEMVAAHNRWRAQVGVGGVTYSAALAASAQAWAEHLRDSNQCKLQHSSSRYGENLYWASAWSNGTKQDVPDKDVVDSWGSEKRDYNYQDNSCVPGQVCGHYTQVVWANTKAIGCGVAICSNNAQIWACQYEPAGNWVGQKPY